MSRLGDLLLAEELSAVEEAELRRRLDILEQDAGTAAQVISVTGLDFNQPVTFNRALTVRSDGGTVGRGARGLFFINKTSGSIVGYAIMRDDANGDLTVGIADKAGTTDTQTLIRFRNVDNGRIALVVDDDELFRVRRGTADANLQEALHFGGSAGHQWRQLDSGGLTVNQLIAGVSGENVLNGQGEDINTRIEGDTITDVFKVDAGKDVTYFRGIGARVSNSANQSIPNDTFTALTFNNEQFDTDTIHSTSTNTSRLTATTAGVYSITGTMRFAGNDTGVRAGEILLNGTTRISYSGNLEGDTHTTVHFVYVSTAYDLAATDYVEFRVYQNSTAALNSETEGTNGVVAPHFTMMKVG